MEKVLKKPPYLIILEGENSKKKAVCGVFCTTNIFDANENITNTQEE